jgi:hypothetical protein
VHGAVAADFLLDNGASVDKWNFLMYTALRRTASSGRVEAVDLLLARGAAIDAQTEDGKTVVHFAIVGNFRTACQFLLAQGVDYRVLDLAKKTVWDVVEKYGRAWARELLARGAQPRRRTRRSRSPRGRRGRRRSRGRRERQQGSRRWGQKETRLGWSKTTRRPC